MRSENGARWAGCALALMSLLSSTAIADGKHVKKNKSSVAECASFDQKDSGDTTVDFTITNACSINVECSVTWSVTCAPDTKHRSRKQEGASFNLAATEVKTTQADASRCGDDGWAIDDVSWSCAPSKD
jgi:hypothetical protein